MILSNDRIFAAVHESIPPSDLALGLSSFGTRGRRFKSCHSDHHLAQITTFTGTDCGTFLLGACGSIATHHGITNEPPPLPAPLLASAVNGDYHRLVRVFDSYEKGISE
jgi:hypothetical protein